MVTFAPLDKGADFSLSLAYRLRGCEEFWGLQRGQLGKCPLCRFRFLLRPKGRISFLSARKTKLCLGFFQGLRKETLATFASKRQAFVCDSRHSVKVLVVFGGRYEYTFRLAGYFDFPLLPFGLSSPVSD